MVARVFLTYCWWDVSFWLSGSTLDRFSIKFSLVIAIEIPNFQTNTPFHKGCEKNRKIIGTEEDLAKQGESQR